MFKRVGIMGGLVFSVVTAALMALIVKAATILLPPDTWRTRRVPWTAVALTALLVAGLIAQAWWSGAMTALDNDPGRTGWWRPVTAVLLQNGGPIGAFCNVITLAVIASLAQWFWGWRLTTALVLVAAVLPQTLALLAGAGRSTDPRNFAGSSGVTYFLGATLAGALLLTHVPITQRLLALAVPALAAIAWFTQANGHGLVSIEGFATGVIAQLVRVASVRLAGHRGPAGIA